MNYYNATHPRSWSAEPCRRRQSTQEPAASRFPRTSMPSRGNRRPRRPGPEAQSVWLHRLIRRSIDEHRADRAVSFACHWGVLSWALVHQRRLVGAGERTGARSRYRRACRAVQGRRRVLGTGAGEVPVHPVRLLSIRSAMAAGDLSSSCSWRCSSFRRNRRFWRIELLYVWIAALVAIGVLMWGGILGLPYVAQDQWGGLPITLILATFGLVVRISARGCWSHSADARRGLPAVKHGLRRCTSN